MGMDYKMVSLSPEQIDALRATPSLASDLAKIIGRDLLTGNLANFVPAEKLEAFNAARRAMMASVPGAVAAEAQLEGARARLEKLGPIEPALGLGKSWHILHYGFTGHSGAEDAPGNTLLTGEPLGEDLGYGPPMLRDPAETRRFAQFLTPLDVAQLQTRINLRAMTAIGIYGLPMGPGTDAEYEAELRAELASCFPALRDYVTRTSERGDGLLTWIS